MIGVYLFRFLKVIFLTSPFQRRHHSLFHLPILFLTFFSSTTFQMHLQPSLNFSLRPMNELKKLKLCLINKNKIKKPIFIFFILIGPCIWINFIIAQQDVTVFSLLCFCRQLYMFLVLTPIIRISCNCNHSFWHRPAGSATVRSRWVGTDSPETCTAAYRNIINRIQSHLVGQL